MAYVSSFIHINAGPTRNVGSDTGHRHKEFVVNLGHICDQDETGRV